MKRNKHDRRHGGADAAVIRVTGDPHNHQALALTVVGGLLKGLAYRVLSLKKCSCEGLVDNRSIRIGIALEKVSTAEQRNLHGLEPARRDVQEVSKFDAGRTAVDRNGIVPPEAFQQSPSCLRHTLNAGDRTQLLSHLVPIERRLRRPGGGFKQKNPVRGKASRLVREPVEGSDKESCNQQDEKTEGYLQGDHCVHQPLV